MFHITNGDSANAWLAECGVTGDFLSWDDVLHEGPVPAGLTLHELSLIRARFISFCGWATEFEAQTHFQTRDARFLDAVYNRQVVIWNSHELFDQLHLLQILSWYYTQGQALARPRIVFVEGLLGDGSQTAAQLMTALEQAPPVSPQQLACADELWQLFTAANPRGLAAAAQQAIDVLPFMQAALQRLVEEYPDLQGVSRTERAVLKALADGVTDPVSLFQAVRQQEVVPFMGDASFWLILQHLCEAPAPLVQCAGGLAFELPDLFSPSDRFRQQTLSLTPKGTQLLAEESDWSDQLLDRWIGGVHLNPDNRWCWSATDFQRL